MTIHHTTVELINFGLVGLLSLAIIIIIGGRQSDIYTIVTMNTAELKVTQQTLLVCTLQSVIWYITAILIEYSTAVHSWYVYNNM